MAGPEVSADELDLLADLDAGLLEGEDLRRAEALARTERGRAALHALARVRGALAALPEPPVPAGLDAWVRSALRASPAVAPFPEAATGSAPRGQDSCRREPRPRGLRGRAWAWVAAGAAAVVLAGTAVGTGLVRPGADGAVTVASGRGVAGSDASGGERSGNGQSESAPAATGERHSAGAGAAERAPASGGTPVDSRPEAAADAPAADSRAPALGVPVLASGRDYRPAELPAAALDLVEQTGRAGTSTGGLVPGIDVGAAPQELVRLRAPGELADCLTSLTGGTVRPLVVDLARLEGQPALVAVLPGSEDQPVVHVAGPGCASGDADRLLVLAP